MKSRRNFLSILVLILAGSIAIPTDYVFAKKSVKTKKKSDKKKKKEKNTSTQSVEAEELRSSDISSERRGGTTATRSTGTGTTTTVDAATETATLTENLKSCLAKACSNSNSSTPYEKCFKSSNIDVAFLSDASCVSYLGAASSEAIRVDAKNAARNYVKSAFTKACESIEGTVSGEKCKIKVWYYAKAPSGAAISRSKDVSVGESFTCTYSNFGLSQQDLEYKGEKTTEQKIAEAQAGIQLATGVLNIGLNAISAIKDSKNLKRANAYEEDAWYKFNGKTLEKSTVCYKYYYGADGSGMKKKDWENEKSSSNAFCDTDANGARFCLRDDEKDLPTTKKSCSNTTGQKECSKENVEQKNCVVHIPQSNEYTRAEKLKELISWMDLENLKSEALKEQRRNAIMQTYAAPELANSISAGASTVNDMSCPERQTVQKSESVKTAEAAAKSMSNKYECREYNNEFRCGNTNYEFNSDYEFNSEKVCNDELVKEGKCYRISGCEWNVSSNNWVMKFKTPIDKVNYINSRADSYAKDVDVALKAMDGLTKSDSTNAYNNTVTAYNDANNKVNTKKKELESLEEKSSSSFQNVVSSGTQVLLTGITTSLTNKYAADGNKELMSGACYKSKTDPKSNLGSANMLVKEGATIKIKYE